MEKKGKEKNKERRDYLCTVGGQRGVGGRDTYCSYYISPDTQDPCKQEALELQNFLKSGLNRNYIGKMPIGSFGNFPSDDHCWTSLEAYVS